MQRLDTHLTVCVECTVELEKMAEVIATLEEPEHKVVLDRAAHKALEAIRAAAEPAEAQRTAPVPVSNVQEEPAPGMIAVAAATIGHVLPFPAMRRLSPRLGELARAAAIAFIVCMPAYAAYVLGKAEVGRELKMANVNQQQTLVKLNQTEGSLRAAEENVGRLARWNTEQITKTYRENREELQGIQRASGTPLEDRQRQTNPSPRRAVLTMDPSEDVTAKPEGILTANVEDLDESLEPTFKLPELGSPRLVVALEPNTPKVAAAKPHRPERASKRLADINAVGNAFGEKGTP